MALNYAYNYVHIDPDTNMCDEIVSDTTPGQDAYDGWMAVPVYSEDYLFKYYIDGAWYEDAEATIPWTPPTE